MATEMTHLLPEVTPNWGYPKWYHYIRFGKCTVNRGYADHGLWFVTIPAGQRVYSTHTPGDENSWPEEEHTFIVPEQFAGVHYFNTFRRDVERWETVAKTVIVGNWCSEHECLWSERPIFSLTLEDGTQVRYGVCGSQPQYRKDRQLWFVSLNKFGDCHTFLVDHVCATPEVIHRLGSNWEEGWMHLCWCHLVDEIDWDKIGTSDDRTQVTWALDSPYIPDTLEDNFRVIEAFEEKQRQKQAEQERSQRQGLFGRRRGNSRSKT